MSELSKDERCKKLSQLISQAPPGEVNDVINDIRALIDDDDALMPHVLPALREYNLSQLHGVEHAAADDIPAHYSLLSEAAILPGSSDKERYVDAQGGRSFAFDHVTLTISDYEPYSLPEEENTFRAELAKSLAAYSKNHFPSGYSSVSTSQHPLLPPEPEKQPEPEPASATEGVTIDEKQEESVPTEKAGGLEPTSTPAVGDVEAKKEEIDEPGGLEKVDEKVEEVKEEEEKEKEEEASAEAAQEESTDPKTEKTAEADATEDTGATDEKTNVETENESEVKDEDATDGAALQDTPKTEEGGSKETEPSEDAAIVAAEQPTAVERKQEKVDNPTYTLEIVGNRYNPTNFWTGRWRTQWIVDQAAGAVNGTIIVDVHYYEQGNVQLSTKHTTSFPCPIEANGNQSIASQIVTNISKIETAYHLELNDTYAELGDKAFRALRRALPITRQKMDWEKVGGYSLGSDLSKARG